MSTQNADVSNNAPPPSATGPVAPVDLEPEQVRMGRDLLTQAFDRLTTEGLVMEAAHVGAGIAAVGWCGKRIGELERRLAAAEVSAEQQRLATLARALEAGKPAAAEAPSG